MMHSTADNESLMRNLRRMYLNLKDALKLYADHQQGQEEAISDVAREEGHERPTEVDRIHGQVRWAGNAIAKGIVDDWRVAEARVALSAQAATVELLLSIQSELRAMNQTLAALASGRDYTID